MSTPLGPYSPVMRAGDFLFVSGQVGMHDGKLADGTANQLRQLLANLRGLLEGEGARIDQVVKTTVFLRHLSDFAPMNEIYMEFFGGHRPARSTIGVTELPGGALVEVEAVAYVGK